MSKIHATAHLENENSIKVLRKLGFEWKEVFDYDGEPTHWFELEKTEWNNTQNVR